uniref:Serpentine receptor class gamma n=1 Tax=Panagrellus redivivus TaxID=6233 RepID=A0A7E4UMJ2_PANRE
MLYMIITKSSKEMSGYKWYLVHQLTWSYVFDVYLCLWKSVPLWPFYTAYSAGVFSEISEKYFPLQMLLLVVTSIGVGFGIYISALHRYMQASPFSFLYKIYSILSVRLIAYVFVYVSLMVIVCVPIVRLIPEHSVLKESVSSHHPVFLKNTSKSIRQFSDTTHH